MTSTHSQRRHDEARRAPKKPELRVGEVPWTIGKTIVLVLYLVYSGRMSGEGVENGEDRQWKWTERKSRIAQLDSVTVADFHGGFNGCTQYAPPSIVCLSDSSAISLPQRFTHLIATPDAQYLV